MNITVRLYKLHDYDLLYLYKNLRFPIRDAMYLVLKAYVKNEDLKLDFPIGIPEEDETVRIKNAQFHLFLDEIKDWELIAHVKSIKNFYRNSFLKNVLRYYLKAPVVFCYEKEADLDETKRKVEKACRDIDSKSLPLMKPRRKRKKI